MSEELVSLEYLLGASQVGMQNALLSRMADERNRRKEIIELMEAWAERRAEVLLLQWFEKHGAELMASVTHDVVAKEIGRLAEPEQTTEDFRESLRKLVKSA